MVIVGDSAKVTVSTGRISPLRPSLNKRSVHHSEIDRPANVRAGYVPFLLRHLSMGGQELVDPHTKKDFLLATAARNMRGSL